MAAVTIIRKASKTDAKNMYELMKQKAADENPDLPLHLTYEDFVDGCWGASSVVVPYVAERPGGKGELEGYILGNRSYCPWLARIITIKELYVIDSGRRSVVALQLCKKLIQTGLKIMCERCDVMISKADEAMVSLAQELGAINVTDVDNWHSFSLDSNMVISCSGKGVYGNEGATIVRLAVPEDMTSVMVMIQELADYEKMSDSPKINADILRRDSPPLETFFECFVAENNGTLVGYAMFYPTFSSKGHGMCLEDFYVKPAYRGHGIGTLLIAEVAKRGFIIGAKHIELIALSWNAPCIAFYEHRGGTDLTLNKDIQLYRISKNEMIKNCTTTTTTPTTITTTTTV